MTCTTPDCEAPTDLYLCHHCQQDLQAWIDKAHQLLPELDDTIAKLDNVSIGNTEGCNGDRTAGSNAPLNIDAMQLKINLTTINQTAHQYANDPHAAPIAALIAHWTTNAELAISGPQDDAPTEHDRTQAAQRIRQEIPAELPVPALIEWLNNIHRITINPARVWQWAKRGHITRTNEKGQAKYSPAAVLIHARKDQLQRLNKNAKV